MSDVVTGVFTVGTTVLLTVALSQPGGRAPLDPDTIVLSSLIDPTGQALSGPYTFTRREPGLYVAPVATDSLAAGTYRWVVKAMSGGNAVVKSGIFVLEDV